MGKFSRYKNNSISGVLFYKEAIDRKEPNNNGKEE